VIKKVTIILLGLFLTCILILTGLEDQTILVVEELNTGIRKEFYPRDGSFLLSYTHSVLLTQVDEYFQITAENELLLQKTVYESFGVGLPYEQFEDASFEIIDGQFVLYLERRFDELNMIISPIPKHTLSLNNTLYYLTDLLAGKKIHVTNESMEQVVPVSSDHAKQVHHIKIYALTKRIFEIGKIYFVI
jgi:hypothetical protein